MFAIARDGLAPLPFPVAIPTIDSSGFKIFKPFPHVLMAALSTTIFTASAARAAANNCRHWRQSPSSSHAVMAAPKAVRLVDSSYISKNVVR